MFKSSFVDQYADDTSQPCDQLWNDVTSAIEVLVLHHFCLHFLPLILYE